MRNSEAVGVLSLTMHRIFLRAAAVFFLAGPATLSAGGRADTHSIPDTRAFLDEVRKNLRSDDALLEEYTFTEKRIERHLDGNGVVKKTKTETFEVYPSAEPGKMYRRLIARDDVPVSHQELAEEDRKQEQKTELSEKKRAAEDEAAKRAPEGQGGAGAPRGPGGRRRGLPDGRHRRRRPRERERPFDGHPLLHAEGRPTGP